jgi:hypothetical protein
MCAMSFIMFIIYLDRVNLSAAAGLIRDDLHLTNTDVGPVFAAFAYTTTVTTGFAGSVVMLFCARMLLGVGEGAALPAQARADELVSG